MGRYGQVLILLISDELGRKITVVHGERCAVKTAVFQLQKSIWAVTGSRKST
jgi:hypothetical protein